MDFKETRKLQHSNLLLFCVFAIVLGEVDYCQIEKEKCTLSSPHIGCNQTAITFKVNPNCSNITMVKLKNSDINYILQIHNELRNKLASGNVEDYPPASRMLEMYWDEELQATACLHAQYCIFEHDKCRATPSYMYPGQNIRISHYTNFPQTNIRKELQNGILDWFNEYADVKSDIIDKYENRPGHKQYGHFTAMAKDNNNRIGCCYITYESYFESTDVIEYSHFFTCNYRETNLINRPVYLQGNPTTKCTDFGTEFKPNNSNYTSLCTNPILHEILTLENEPETRKDEVTNLSTVYCELGKTKCGRNKHIGCAKDSAFKINPSCKNIELHNMTEYQGLLIKEHNKYRDLIASGKYMNFPSASKMLQLEWDTQLEDVACQYVKYCQMSHPAECLATLKYDLPGQSIYHEYRDRKMKSHDRILKEAVRIWFNQSYFASSDIINRYENKGDNYFGSFALMVREAQSKIGCCFITFEEYLNDYLWHSYFLTCVYEHINYLHTQLYDKGAAASSCHDYGEKYTSSDIYPSLCTKNTVNGKRIIEDVLKEQKLNENISKYCEIEIKKCSGRRHIGCEIDPGLEVNPDCIDIQMVNMTKEMKEIIINSHNNFRNQVAEGKVSNYPSANKMLQMTWDTELATLACQHVSKCSMQLDECRATESYDSPGQSIYGTYSNKMQFNYSKVLQQGIQHFFNEHLEVKSDIIDSFEDRPPTLFYHFLLMVKENNDKIGCCYITNKIQMNDKTWYSHMFTCNYRDNINLGQKAYTKGKPASECHQWGMKYNKSELWNNLCVAI